MLQIRYDVTPWSHTYTQYMNKCAWSPVTANAAQVATVIVHVCQLRN
jgi:hypothetical protein